MDIKEIKRIVELMKANDLSEFELEEDNFRLALRRGAGGVGQAMAAPAMMMPAAPPVETAAPVAAAPESEDDEGLLEITSPMVGTFYRSPSPEAESFIEVGAVVDAETVVCIIEAMKVMNEIKSEIKGTVKKVLVEAGAPVEFGQPLFLVEPA